MRISFLAERFLKLGKELLLFTANVFLYVRTKSRTFEIQVGSEACISERSNRYCLT